MLIPRREQQFYGSDESTEPAIAATASLDGRVCRSLWLNCVRVSDENLSAEFLL